MTTHLDGPGVRRARLHAQLLGGTGQGRDVPGVVSAVVGVQAQGLAAAALGVRARAPDTRVADVVAALGPARSVVLTWSLRGTRHFHHAEDLRWLVGLLGPVFGRPGRRARQLGIAGEAGDRAVAAVRDALSSGGPLTRPEIKERLASVGVDTSGQAPVHVLQRAALEGILCVLPDPHGEERYVLLDEWVPPSEPVEPERALPVLADRFLSAHGPATPADFRAWSGLPSALARTAWEGLAGRLLEVDGPAGPAWVLARRREAVLAAAEDPGPLRLTGGFDSLLLGYADRSLLLSPGQAGRVNAGGGLLKPVVLDDGQVVGTWRYVRERPRDRIRVTSFGPLDRAAPGLDREAEGIGRFLGTDPVLDLEGAG